MRCGNYWLLIDTAQNPGPSNSQHSLRADISTCQQSIHSLGLPLEESRSYVFNWSFPYEVQLAIEYLLQTGNAPVYVNLTQAGAAPPAPDLPILSSSSSVISSSTASPAPRPTWKAWPESGPSQRPSLSRGEKGEQNKSKRATHSCSATWLIARGPVLPF